MPRKKPISSAGVDNDTAGTALQLTVRLKHVSPPIWRRVLVASTMTLRELHGVLQVAMGWEGIHLFLFRIRAVSYGSWELSVHSPDIALSSLKLRVGARFTYEYDLNLPWEHEVRVEAVAPLEGGQLNPKCLDGKEPCPPEECPGPAWFMENRDAEFSIENVEDYEVMSDFLGELLEKDGVARLREEGALDEISDVVERMEERQRWRGVPFKLADVNERLKSAEHLDLMYQQQF